MGRKTLDLNAIHQRPHRGKLDRDHVLYLARELKQFAGIAVAHEPGTGYVLVGGEHRYAALRYRRQESTEVYDLRAWNDLVAWLMVDRAFGARYPQTPWNGVDAAHFQEKAAALLKPAKPDRPGDDIGEYTGIHPDAVRVVRGVLRNIISNPDEDPQVREYTRQQLREVSENRITGHSLTDRIVTYRLRLSVERQGVQGLMPPARQRQLLENATTNFAGIADAVRALGRLHPDLTPEECAGWVASIHGAQQMLYQLKKQLKERANSTP